jgi:hypothetical protein
MQLTKEQRAELSALKKHPWYATLLRIEEEAMNNLGRLVLTWDLDNPQVLEVVKKNKIYAKARQDFFANIESHLMEVYTPEVH